MSTALKDLLKELETVIPPENNIDPEAESDLHDSFDTVVPGNEEIARIGYLLDTYTEKAQRLQSDLLRCEKYTMSEEFFIDYIKTESVITLLDTMLSFSLGVDQNSRKLKSDYFSLEDGNLVCSNSINPKEFMNQIEDNIRATAKEAGITEEYSYSIH